MAPGGLTEDGYSVGITSEAFDIFSNPLEDSYLVLEAEVAPKFWMREIAKRTKPVVETDHRDTHRRQVRPVSSIFTPTAAQITTTVNPNHHRLPCLNVYRTSPNVQVQTVFALVLGSRFEYRTGSLRTYRAELLSLSDSRPRRDRRRRSPTEFTDRRLGVGHT